ncbi:L-seryl-tRNA(Sec) selenium transferase [Chondromyces apiculatus]|uniref:L-seryl-tRNA(Sec) selenium transferase n=1 Tax=Chondromyces apiculatus DSM 436 TaxID=1192034 RepID=A0A017SZP5_9BACT|nr:L-seryl-tRNA(Sec) selenium transferase [Chondromyces apiculatus]EYF02242.1 L-seryl-tRNA(Sec) selenium transferase [Chondromyces apiculatus DSM 436]
MTKVDLSRLPRVDRVAQHPSLAGLRRRLGAEAMTRLARRVIEEARAGVRAGASCPSEEEAVARLMAAAQASLSARSRAVINATGVVLHTNLGRAPLGPRAVQALARAAGGYTSLEVDLSTGRRGPRGAFAEGALASLAGAEAVLLVNNGAAAVMLALGALSAGKKVLVSRGELVEIGGGFRVPEVLARSGAELSEVGTTNRTRVADYAQALERGGVGAILRVHQGNFRQVGFVERPERRALSALAREAGVWLVEDLGGGALVDLTPSGLGEEPTVQACVSGGVDVVCFSTDKVLGGPQGGALVGRSEAVERARRDPLARALRMGRLPLAALEETLACYLEGDLDGVPTVRMLKATPEALRARAEGWREALGARGIAVEVVMLEGAVGGGALAEAALPSAGIAFGGEDGKEDVEEVAARLRAGEPAVVGRVQEGRVLLDARTVLPGEEEALLAAVVAAVVALKR